MVMMTASPFACAIEPRQPSPALALLARFAQDAPMQRVPEPSSMSDHTRLLVAVRDLRDRAAFARLFDHFAPRLKAMMLRGGLGDGVAEDVAQEVMLAVWRKAHLFDPHRAEASAWIYGIARNRRVDQFRRRPPPQPEMLEPYRDDEPDPAQILALGQEVVRLRAALAALNGDQAQMIEKAYLGELTHAEISKQSGVPIGTVKSRIRLGLERLRHELKGLREP
jgi:RNA polymerase sigma-70 factor, ECF subfamily